jgi:hypothetical protein
MTHAIWKNEPNSAERAVLAAGCGQGKARTSPDKTYCSFCSALFAGVARGACACALLVGRPVVRQRDEA